jgi:hypothetical protein
LGLFGHAAGISSNERHQREQFLSTIDAAQDMLADRMQAVHL